MRRLWIGGFFALAVLLAGQAPAWAQAPPAPGGFGRPNYNGGYQNANVLSPWLSLGLGTNNPAINLYNGVFSEMARRADERRFGTAITNIDRRLSSLEPEELFPVLPGTGHPTAFMNYGGYFSMGRGANRPIGSSASPNRPTP